MPVAPIDIFTSIIVASVILPLLPGMSDRTDTLIDWVLPAICISVGDTTYIVFAVLSIAALVYTLKLRKTSFLTKSLIGAVTIYSLFTLIVGTYKNVVIIADMLSGIQMLSGIDSAAA